MPKYLCNREILKQDKKLWWLLAYSQHLSPTSIGSAAQDGGWVLMGRGKNLGLIPQVLVAVFQHELMGNADVVISI